MLRFLRNRTLEQSFAFSTALLVAVLVVATLVLVHSRVSRSLTASLVDRGRSIARSIGAVSTPSLLAYNYPALQIAADSAARDAGIVYVAIHDKEGGLAGLAGSVDLGSAAVRDLPREDAAPIRDIEIRDADDGVETVLEVAAPVHVDGVPERWGTIRVGLTYGPLTAKLRVLLLWLIALGLTLALVAMLTGRWLARRITAPLRDLSDRFTAVGSGRTGERIHVAGARELAELADSYNRMAERLEDTARESESFRKALEALNATLEEQVRERTRALEESEAQYKTLVEHSPDSILIVQDGRVRFVNRAFSETFGVTPDVALSDDFELGRVLDPRSATVARSCMASWERGETSGPVELRGRDAAGHDVDLELRGSRIEYRGRPAAECLLIDTTEARRLRERLADTERLRALGELSSGVAHDFNNLLSAILGRVQLLKRAALDPKIERDLTVVEKAALDGRETVRRIMEFTRTRQGETLSPVSVPDVVRDAVEITRTKWKTDCERKNIHVEVVLELEPVPAVLGRHSELREVFTNLILNAVDAMPRGGTVTLACRSEGDHVIVRVEDTGVGMTDEIRRHLFDPFFTTKGHAGSGLGLSVVYGIVSRHEGRLDISTSLGRGTVFRMAFPAIEAADSSTVEARVPPPATTRPSRILVIDDEPAVADVLREALAAEGHDVETALTGGDGVKMVSLTRFDLVFTDLGMPDMSGWEVVRKVHDRSPEMPVILVTGWGAGLDEEEVRRHDISAVVHKPFRIEDVVSTTAGVLASRAGGTAEEPLSSRI